MNRALTPKHTLSGRTLCCLCLCMSLALWACGGGQTTGNKTIDQLKTNAANAETEAQYEEALEQALRILTANPDDESEVWARGKILQKAAQLGKRDLYETHFVALEPKLAALLTRVPVDQLKTNPTALDAYRQADAGIHDIHAALSKLWIDGQRDPETTALIDRITSAFMLYFPESLFLSEVLFYEAQRVEAAGNAFEAILLYEEMIRKDFQGKHDKTARGIIEGVWTKATSLNPLHGGKLPPERPLQGPIASMLADAQTKVSDPSLKLPQKRTLQHRIATAQLAFGLSNDAFTTYESIARDALDGPGLDAIIRRVKISMTLEGPAAFHRWREALSPAQWADLWRAEPWRKFMLELAALKLPLGGPHVEEVYALYNDLIATHNDEATVDAAIGLLNAAATNMNPLDFRQIRKTLQASEFLWSQPRFKTFLYDIKKRVEGKD